MSGLIKKILKPFVPRFVLDRLKKHLKKKDYETWKKNGCPAPPPHIVKQMVIREYQERSGYSLLVETGTHLGNMVEAQKSIFKQIISIELDLDFFEKAKERFKKDKHIRIVQGDSGKVLPSIMEQIDEPAIFWLDGHYSGGVTALDDKKCPIFDEMDAVFDGKKLNHILLIDDARDFTGKKDYPTIDELTNYITNKDDRYQVAVEHDIIRYMIQS